MGPLRGDKKAVRDHEQETGLVAMVMAVRVQAGGLWVERGYSMMRFTICSAAVVRNNLLERSPGVFGECNVVWGMITLPDVPTTTSRSAVNMPFRALTLPAQSLATLLAPRGLAD